MRLSSTILATFLAVCAASAADQDFVVLDNGARIPVRKAIPVLSDASGPAGWHTSAPRPRVESNLHNGIRTNHQGFHVDYRIAPEGAPQIGFDLDAGFRTLDSLTGDSIDPSLSRRLQISHGGHLRWTGPNRLEITLSSKLETALRDSLPLQEHAYVQKGLLAFDPLPRTTLRTSIGSTDRHRLDGTLLHEDAFSTSVEHRLPALPVRLSLSQSSSWLSPMNSDQGDIERHRLLGSAVWNFHQQNTLSVGLESTMLSREADNSSELTSITFTELRLQPLPQLDLRLRATAEDREAPGGTGVEDGARILIPSISAGLDIQLAPGFETGIGLLYRPNAPATPANPTAAPAQFTIFGSALF